MFLACEVEIAVLWGIVGLKGMFFAGCGGNRVCISPRFDVRDIDLLVLSWLGLVVRVNPNCVCLRRVRYSLGCGIRVVSGLGQGWRQGCISPAGLVGGIALTILSGLGQVSVRGSSKAVPPTTIRGEVHP